MPTKLNNEQKTPICEILGVKISAINMPWLLNFVRENLSEIKGDYICVANVHTVVTATDILPYKEAQNNAILTIPDGGPLSKVGNKRGFTEMARTTGPDFMREIFEISEEKGYTHYFYGSTTDTLQLLQSKLHQTYPYLKIVGAYSPPFRELTEEENNSVIKSINNSGADFVWVGLGAPKQELWMAEHKGKINGLMVGVGAGFDYFAGNIKRAPMWMQKNNLEWLYRLIQEPSRLFKRYLITNTKFIFNVIIRRK